MTDLHFLRPAWLLLLFLLPLLLWALRHGGIGDSGWSRWIPRHLLTPWYGAGTTRPAGTRSPGGCFRPLPGSASVWPWPAPPGARPPRP